MTKLSNTQARNVEAEGRFVRENLWGQEQGQPSEAEDEMGHTVLGDITGQPPIIINQPSQNQIGPLLAGLALGVAPLLGLGGYMLANQKPQPQQIAPAEFDDSTVDIRLGKLEDYTHESRKP